VFSNPAFDSMFGYDEDELLGQRASVVDALVDADGKPGGLIADSLGEKGSWEGELCGVRKDGSTFWTLARISSFEHPDHGKVWIDVRSDITDRKKVEAYNTELLQDISEQLNELTCLHVIAESIASNQSLDEIFQNAVTAIPRGWRYPETACSRLRFQGKEWTSDAFEETEWKLSVDIMCSGESCGCVEIFYVDIPPDLDDDPFTSAERKLIENIGHTLSETIERRQTEERLQESRALFDSYMSVAPVGMAILDTDARYVNLNEELASINGVTVADHLGKHPSEVLPGPLGETSDKQVRRILETGQPIVNEEISGETLGETGVTRHWLRSMFAVYGARQEISGVGAMVVETTEATRVAEQLRQSQKMEALGILAGGVAHDINNMLYPVFVNAELLLENCDPDGADRPLLDDILASARQAKDLVSQILIFGRRDRGTIEVCDFIEVAIEAMKLLRPALPETISIELDYPESAIPVSCDFSQLYQVVVNLFTNAEKAVSGSGKIKLVLEPIEVDGLQCIDGTSLTGRFACLTVTDDGAGIDDQIRSKIFDPFFTTMKPGQGTGLGLSTVFGIVQNHGGGITLSSELGTGSTFGIYLPIAEPAPREAQSAAEDTSSICAERILFVDDIESIRKSARVCLERCGYSVVTAGNGQEALDLFQADPTGFDLVITDQTMPEMTGQKLSANLLSLRSDLPIVICTGHSEGISLESCRDMGIRAFLQKPPSPADLRRVVREVLDEVQTGSSTH
jgi:PAS domain S-box-containing protein